ncbi:keratin-associated protein 20-2 [Drosophila bipectinata]|uniref:keratin-associated protein 20-2 n=1 Tax=Drosophila bipectinata TaxID=42026 RepID=UPI001C88E2EC|nr:shematrin-like protein 3 [Drosophila bipectinata]
MSAKQTSSYLRLALILAVTVLRCAESQYYGYPYYGVGTGAGAGAGAGSAYGNVYGNGIYGYPSYGGYPYYSYPSYNPYSMYGGYGQYGGYPYSGYPYGGSGINTAYASSSGGFATASAGGNGYYG